MIQIYDVHVPEDKMQFKDGTVLEQRNGSINKVIKAGFLLLGLMILLMVSGIQKAQAVPSLGVATNGTYYYDPTQYSQQSLLSSYQSAYTNTFFQDSTNGGYEGFGIGPSGSTLDIFTNDTTDSIWLLTDASVISKNDPTFDGKSFSLFPSYTGTIPASYTPKPYYGIDLGRVGSGWTSLPNPPFSNGPYYQFAGTLDYTGSIAQGNYFFAVSTTLPSLGTLDVTHFSPATTSAVGTVASTPENSTLVMTGTALGLLLFLARRRKISLRI